MISQPNFKLETAKSGDLTLQYEGGYIHSRYNPRREAHRFVENLQFGSVLRTILLLGDGLGYITETIRRRFPAVKLLSFSLTGEWSEDVRVENTLIWRPDTENPENWLRNRLDAGDLSGLEVIVWRPATAAVPEFMDALGKAVHDVVKELRSELATVAVFGRRWIKNALLQTLIHEKRLEPTSADRPVTVVGAGPGLDAHSFVENDNLLVAVSSAAEALKGRNVNPVLWVHFDGGYWASRYMKIRYTAPIALPLRASRIETGGITPILLGGEWFGEELAPDAGDWPAFPDAPSVTIGALHLARRIAGTAEVHRVGTDFSSLGIQFHCKPHLNDEFLRSRSDRLEPFDTTMFNRIILPPENRGHLDRSDVVRWTSPVLEMYQREFNRVLTAPATGKRSADRPKGTSGLFIEYDRPRIEERTAYALNTLRRWRDSLYETAGPSSETRKLALHLAPVETLAYFRGEAPFETVAEPSIRFLRRLEALIT